MSGIISIPRAVLELVPSAVHRGILVCLLERADMNGELVISVRGFADEAGVSYQTMRTALSKLSDNAIINAVPTQRLTRIVICDIGCYNVTPRKRQRSPNATANAMTNQLKPEAGVLDMGQPRHGFVAPAFERPFAEWLDYKKEQFNFIYRTERSLKAAYDKLVALSGGNPRVASLIVNQSMGNGWKGLFELKNNETGTPRNASPRPQGGHAARRKEESGRVADGLRELMDSIARENGVG